MKYSNEYKYKHCGELFLPQLRDENEEKNNEEIKILMLHMFFLKLLLSKTVEDIEVGRKLNPYIEKDVIVWLSN